MEFAEIKELSLDRMNEIVNLEKGIFTGGGVDLWLLKALFRYGKIFVVENDGFIISIAEFMRDFSEKKVLLYGLCTQKKYLRQGCAEFLMLESEKRLKELGIDKIELTVDPKNFSALKLYEKLGYKQIEYRESEYGIGNDRFFYTKIF